MTTKIFLGKCIKTDGHAMDENLYLTKHKWDCGWYWGFGYLGNKNLHTHFDSMFLDNFETDITKCFTNTKITQNDWWVILDLFKQAYAIKNAYNIYYMGNANISGGSVSLVINKNKIMIDALKNDLLLVLESIWNLFIEINSRESLT